MGVVRDPAGGDDRLDPVVLLRGAGFAGPVLVVAEGAATARLAPAWAESFAAAGWTHRVFAAAGVADACEIGAITAEAKSLRAAVLVAAGDASVVAAVAQAAVGCRLPWVALPFEESGIEPATL